MEKDNIAKEIEIVYRALHQHKMNIIDVIVMSKEATLAGNVMLVSNLSHAIFARADEQDKMLFSKFLYRNGQKDLIPLPYMLRVKHEVDKL
ncbi:MAG: hypothetical protein NTY68_00030 [Candidatus Micrarchaeota archaeon]|nr:hypothetical protein [Candidatus Micrarchaeota archaeon]